MRITVFSFLMSMLWSSGWILLVHVCRKKPSLIRRFGTKKILFFYVLSVLRMLLPCEFFFARQFPSRGVLQELEQGIRIHEEKTVHALLLSMLFFVWLGVSAALFVRFFCRYLKSAQACARCGMGEQRYQRKLQRILNENKSQMKFFVRCSKHVGVPMGFGIFQKSILLPEKDYSDEELYFVLLHEYTHFKNGDLLIKCLVQILCCVCWWNPAVYLLKKDLSQILEIQCDLDVTERIQDVDKAKYLMTIVSVLKNASQKRRADVFCGAAALVARNRQSETVERFQIVSMDGVVKNRAKVFTAAWAAALLLFLAVSYAFAAQPDGQSLKAVHMAEESSFVNVMKSTRVNYVNLYGELFGQ